ncbi:TPA: hypothetical protein DCX24_06300, partial [Candidatus Azambacteria bacterium]|nr:hypothetical protein [Candidatus Azambacteria bacterium]
EQPATLLRELKTFIEQMKAAS